LSRARSTLLAVRVLTFIIVSIGVVTRIRSLLGFVSLFQPFFFSLRAPITYLVTLDELPADAHYFLIQPRHQPKFESNPRWAVLRPKLLAHTPSYRSKESLLFAIDH